MKESTGELSMVVITILAVIAILALWNVMSNTLKDWVNNKFGQMMNGTTSTIVSTDFLNM